MPQDLGPDLLGKVTDLDHHIIQPFVLGKRTEGWFVLCNVQKTRIETDIVSHLGQTAEDDVVRSSPRSNLNRCSLVKAGGPSS